MRAHTSRFGLLFVAVALLVLAAGCKPRTGERQVVIRCDGCQQVDLHENFQAGAVVGVVRPGQEGIAKDQRWGKLLGCMMYDVQVGDQEGWVCEKFLTFK